MDSGEREVRVIGRRRSVEGSGCSVNGDQEKVLGRGCLVLGLCGNELNYHPKRRPRRGRTVVRIHKHK